MRLYKNFPYSFDLALIFSASLLLIIWCIPNTIALRNITLFIGACVAIAVISNNYLLVDLSNRRWVPLFFLGGLFVWVPLHFLFFSLDWDLELNEIRGIWARSFAGALIAIALPIALIKKPKLIKLINICFLSTPAINICLYFYASFSAGYFLTPQTYVTNYIFKKIETVFYGSLFIAIACGNIAFLFSRLKKQSIDYKIYGNASVWFIGVMICILSAIISNTKNGIIISLFSIAVLILVVIFNFFRKKIKNWLCIFIVAGALALTLNALSIHMKFSDAGWNSLYGDIKIAVQIDDFQEWKTSNGAEVLPVNSFGGVVNGSTYMRVAWAIAGARLIVQHPFGYGSINRSFDLLLQRDSIEHWSHGQTHSGWVDFGLAYGIPGIILLLGALISIILLSLKFNSCNSYLCFFIAICFIPLALIAETTWKQYFESTIFYITFAAALLLVDHSVNLSAKEN